MTEPNLDIRKWLKDTGWLWHESSVITPECMDDLQAYIARQVKEARIDELIQATNAHSDYLSNKTWFSYHFDKRREELKGDNK